MNLPGLSARGRLRPERAALVACLRAAADPLTGHRGQEGGTAVVARAGAIEVVLQLTSGRDGATLHGLLAADSRERLFGALVHARGEDGAALAAVRARGDFQVRGWAGALAVVDIETEDGWWRLDWPREAP